MEVFSNVHKPLTVNELSTGTIQESELLILSCWYELSLQSLYIFECD